MSIRVVPATEIGGVARLEALFVRVFGGEQRPPGWFARKLRREVIDERLSVVALESSFDPQDPAGWRGFVLAGAPPSLPGRVRTAGTGVLAPARRRGIGRALLEAVRIAGRSSGLRRLRIHASRPEAPFYVTCGLVPVTEQTTVLAHGRGAVTVPWGTPRPWDVAAPGQILGGWLAEAWARTDAALRASVTLAPNGGVGHVSREGQAHVVHRIRHPSDWSADRAANALLARLPMGVPVFIPAVDAAVARESLAPRGWIAVQPSTVMECPL